jgi:8-amino-7-oxononanoate synthase
MSDNKSLSVEEKRELLKKMLREKAAQAANNGAVAATAPAASGTKNFSAFTDFEQFPEVQTLRAQMQTLDMLQVENPYFRVNEKIVNNRTQIEGRDLLSFSSYNYTGLSGDPRVSEAAREAVLKYGTSVSASRIATGEKPLHRELEMALADLIGTEDAITLVSGHATNVTVIGHLMRSGKDLIVYDALSHNCIIEGAVLSGARRIAFPHEDWEALDRILTENRGDYERVLITIEGVYSMDGDIANLPKFIEIKKKHHCLLLVDEAHSMGVIGPDGLGARDYFGIDASEVDLWMGTFSKSFASCGGYIAGKKTLIDFLKYNTPGFVYSVGISPANAAAALASTHIMKTEPWRANKAVANANLFLELAAERGLDTGPSKDTAVVPVITGNSAHALMLADALFKDGINVQPILYPAVPDEAARLRFFITSDHTEDEIRFAVKLCADHLDRIRKDHAAVSFPKTLLG